MAEAIVGFVVKKLDSILTVEVNLFGGAHEEVRYIKNELEAMRLFLTNADPMMGTGKEEDENFKAWVKQVRELAFCIEDIIDKWTLYMAQRRDHRGFLRKLCWLLKKLKQRRRIALEINEIKKKVVEVKDRYGGYNMNLHVSPGTGEGESGNAARGSSSNLYDPRMNSLFVAEAELVGIQGPKEDLISRLVDGNVVSKNKMISVVGVGGLGKTTLVKKVFDDPRVTAYSNCHAWITVSQFYKHELLRDLIKQLYSTTREAPTAALVGINALGEVLLISKLREYLTKKRYVIVFDDVWEADFWDYIKLALPENERGNRIMFTTRNENIIPSSKESPFHYVYKLETLPHDKAFELFCKKAFHFDKGSCPPNLIELSNAIVKKCEGLPLAIVTIGGLLATKNKGVLEWRNLNNGLGSILASNQQFENDQQLTRITRILSLSYHDLSYQVKNCFLYLGIFPANYVMNYNKIMRLWMGEGLIKGREGVALADVAEEYLTELLHRNLVQVAGTNVQGRVRECQIHDLLREIIICPRLEELGLHHVSGDRDSKFNGRCRHLAIQDWTNDVAEHLNNSQVSSMILLGKGKKLGSKFFMFLDNSKLLTALDLEKAPLDYIPEELGDLLHLRYLSLKETKVKALPNSIGRLENLQTLDLRRTLVYDIPIEISRLPKLQYLLAYSINSKGAYTVKVVSGLKIHKGIGCLKALQKLYFIEVEQGLQLISELGRLTQLKKLGVTKVRATDGSALCNVLEKMTCLRSLHIFSANAEEPLKLESMIVPPPLLVTLGLAGPLGELPHWIPKLTNLVKLILYGSRLRAEEDPLQVLQALPNLEELQVYQGYEGERLHFSKGYFAKMKVMHLYSLNGLKTLVIEEGALPLLRELHLGPCLQLEELPNFHFLGNLNTLRLYDLQKHFVFDLLPEGDHHYWKIKHVPNVTFWIKHRVRMYHSYKLGDPGLVKRLNESSS